MLSVTSPLHSWSFEDRCHIQTNGSASADHEDIQITLLQLQLEVSLIREKGNGDQRQLRESVRRELDALKREVDDIRLAT